MKKLITIVLLGAAVCVALPGCSKKDESQSSRSNPSGGSTSTTVASGPPVELKIKWVVGKKYLQHMEVSSDSKMNVGGKPMEQTMTMGSEYSISAKKELDGGGRALEVEFVAQKMESAMGGQTMVSFDSASDPANDGRNPVAPMLRKMIGARIDYETDVNGHVQHVSGFEEMINNMGGNTPQGAMIKSMYNEETLKQFADFSRGLPDHPVKIGESWPLKLDMPMGQLGTFSLDLTYTFKGWGDHGGRKCAELDYAGTLTSKSDPKMGGMALTIDNGKVSGMMWFDPEAGTMVENNSEQSMNMKVTPAPNQTINMVMAQKTSVKLMDVTDIK